MYRSEGVRIEFTRRTVDIGKRGISGGCISRGGKVLRISSGCWMAGVGC